MRDERSELKLPDFFHQMLERKWLGDKTKGGFYKKAKARTTAEDERLALDWKTLEYRPRQKPKFPALDMAKNVEDTGARVRMLLGLDGTPQKGDKAGAFLWAALSDLWTYCRESHPRNFRHGGRNRSRHEAGLQLGDGAVRTVGRGRGRGDGRAHEEGRQAGRRERREAAGLGQEDPGTPTMQGCHPDVLTSIWQPATGKPVTVPARRVVG